MLLGPFWKSRKATIIFAMSVRPSVWNNSTLTGPNPRKFTFEDSSKICWEKSSLNKTQPIPAAACLLGMWPRISPAAWLCFSCEYCGFCLVEVFVSSWLLVEWNPTECDVRGCDRTGSAPRGPCCTPGCFAMTKKLHSNGYFRIISLFICWFISVFPWKQQWWVRFIEHKVRRLLPLWCYGVLQRTRW